MTTVVHFSPLVDWREWRGALPREAPANGRDPVEALAKILSGESDCWLRGYVTDSQGTVVGFVFCDTNWGLFGYKDFYIHLWPYTVSR